MDGASAELPLVHRDSSDGVVEVGERCLAETSHLVEGCEGGWTVR
jgi:hypothetical protein